jgi:hypothetical protein
MGHIDGVAECYSRLHRWHKAWGLFISVGASSTTGNSQIFDVPDSTKSTLITTIEKWMRINYKLSNG